MNATPDGQFPHEPEPTARNLVSLCDEVRRQKASVGFAQDPDADRLAIVDENGNYIGEEYSLVLAAKWIMSRKAGAVAVANLSSSRMLDDIAAASGGRVIRTPVGEANVIDAMLKNQSAIGGEGNGGVIDPRIVPGRDSLVGMAYVLQLMAATNNNRSASLSARFRGMRSSKTKFDCKARGCRTGRWRRSRNSSSMSETDMQDGIRIDWENAWVHARAEQYRADYVRIQRRSGGSSQHGGKL